MFRNAPLVFFALVQALPLAAQLDRGMITGTVTDASRASVPGAQVRIRNSGNNAEWRSQVTATGQFTAPNLPVGLYEVSVEAPGFRRAVRAGLELRVAEVLRADIELQIGPVTESVEVSAEVNRVQTDSPQVGTSLTNRNIIDLPLSFAGARSPEAFAFRLTPGVLGDTNSSYINGSTASSKEVLLDGASVSTYRAGHSSESAVSLEAIQEFKVQTSGMSAEFGRFQAGVFNFVMKSGQNRVHGSGYAALRNEALNANSWVNNFRGIPRPPDRRQNGAASFGGPVYVPRVYNGRDRSFFYLSWERYRERTEGFGAPNRTVPLPEFYDGNFSRLLQNSVAGTDGLGRPVFRGAIFDPATFRRLENGRWIGEMFPGNIIPRSRFSQLSQRVNAIAQKHYLPTVRDANGLIPLVNNSIFPVAGTPQFDQHQFSVKGDQFIGSRHKLSGSFTWTARPRLLTTAGGMWDPEDPTGGPFSKARTQRVASRLGRLAWDWTITPRLLANVNASWNRMVNPNFGVRAATDGAKELGIEGLSSDGYPVLNWGGGPFVTLDTPGDSQNGRQVYHGGGLMATFSLSKGRHFVKWGLDMRTNHYNSRPTNVVSVNFAARGTAIPNETFSGTQTGYSFASYLLGIVDSAGRGVSVPLGGRRRYTALFAQDDFKATRTLTLNLGLRWEFQPPYTEMYDRMASWNTSKPDPQTGLRGAYDFAGHCSYCTGRRYFGERTWTNFGPRFGLAWQARPRWTVRAAYGIFFEADLFNGNSGVPGTSAFPWQGSYNYAADPVEPWRGLFNWDRGFPNTFIPGTPDVSWANRAGGAPAIIDPRYGSPSYAQQWNFNVQRQLSRRMLLDLGYVGNKTTGIKNEQLARMNQLPASVLTDYGRSLANPVQNAQQAAANGVPYPFPGFRGTVAGALRQFPQLQGVATFTPYGSPLGFANYHSLQVTVDRQLANGLNGYASYVWSKALANTETSFVGDNPGPLDYYNLRLEKAVAPHDRPHALKAFVQYELPFGRGRAWRSPWRAVDHAIGGWAVSAILNYFSGTPLGFGGASSPMPGGWNGGQRPNIAAGSLKAASFDAAAFNFANTSAPSNTYVNKGLFSDPAPLTLGSAAPRYSTIRGFPTLNEDVGLLKNMRFHDQWRIQFRAELLNLFNRHTLGGINTSINSPLFGQVTSVTGNRTVQVGLRLDF